MLSEGRQTGKDALSTIGVSKGKERCLRSPSPRYPRAHRRTGDDRGCQRRPRNMAQPGDFQKLADQHSRKFRPYKPLGVRRSRVQIPSPPPIFLVRVPIFGADPYTSKLVPRSNLPASSTVPRTVLFPLLVTSERASSIASATARRSPGQRCAYLRRSPGRTQRSRTAESGTCPTRDQARCRLAVSLCVPHSKETALHFPSPGRRTVALHEHCCGEPGGQVLTSIHR